MTYQIDREIERFETFTHEAGASVTVERLCEYGVLVKPKAGGLPPPGGKRSALTLMGITHGNEWAGIAVLNEILSAISAGAVRLQIPVAFLLGNPWAARENKRFLDRDLNRSFSREGSAKEEVRAKALTQVLQDTAFILDFHQTSRRSERPFFIFPYSARSFAFARAVGPRHTIVTHWGKPFSTEGMCSDEFVNTRGGTGISLELGQNGFDPYQIAVGVDCGLWAIRTVTAQLEGATDTFSKRRAAEAEVYTWADIMPWPEGNYVELDERWYNFHDVAKGEQLGTVDGKPLLASATGRMLFPKYLTREQQQQLVSRPTELCRIMKRIEVSELPG